MLPQVQVPSPEKPSTAGRSKSFALRISGAAGRLRFARTRRWPQISVPIQFLDCNEGTIDCPKKLLAIDWTGKKILLLHYTSGKYEEGCRWVSLVQMLLVQESSCALGRTNSFVHSELVSAPKLQLVRKRPNPVLPLTQVLGPSRERDQVAAVCYRVRRLKIEFLLVRTRKGKWTFPKGGVVGGLTRAQSAALEAFEEGGVHGRIERASFTRYILRKRRSSQAGEITIDAYLCEVLRLGTPQEVNRTPTWFTAEEAQFCLREGRTTEDAGELARVVDRAVSRLERLTQGNSNGRRANIDPLQKVHFEAPDNLGGRLVAHVALLPYPQAKGSRSSQPPIIEFGDDSPNFLQLGPGRPPGRLPSR